MSSFPFFLIVLIQWPSYSHYIFQFYSSLSQKHKRQNFCMSYTNIQKFVRETTILRCKISTNFSLTPPPIWQASLFCFVVFLPSSTVLSRGVTFPVLISFQHLHPHGEGQHGHHLAKCTGQALYVLQDLLHNCQDEREQRATSSS